VSGSYFSRHISPKCLLNQRTKLIRLMQWHLLSSSNNFTTYLSAYSVFLSSIAGVMICDYYVVRKGYYDIKELYSARKHSPYFFTYGFSWHAYASYIAGILINIVGFVGAVGRDVPIHATYIYNLNFFCGFIVAFTVYYLLTWLVPVQATSKVWNEVDIDTKDWSVAYTDGVTVHDEETVSGTGREVSSESCGDEDSKHVDQSTMKGVDS
jgi:NCS1 family nucleobase:cation symporter-1